jgi:four helix bundle protein
MALRTFEDLDVWKRACRLAVAVCEELRACKDFGLRDQMQRAAISIPSNIAEGSERDSRQDFVRFLRIAKGSAAELRTQCYIASKLGVVPGSRFSEYAEDCKAVSAMLQALIRSLIPPESGKRNTEN